MLKKVLTIAVLSLSCVNAQESKLSLSNEIQNSNIRNDQLVPYEDNWKNIQLDQHNMNKMQPMAQMFVMQQQMMQMNAMLMKKLSEQEDVVKVLEKQLEQVNAAKNEEVAKNKEQKGWFNWNPCGTAHWYNKLGNAIANAAWFMVDNPVARKFVLVPFGVHYGIKAALDEGLVGKGVRKVVRFVQPAIEEYIKLNLSL